LPYGVWTSAPRTEPDGGFADDEAALDGDRDADGDPAELRVRDGTGGPAATAPLDADGPTTRTPASAALWGCSPLTQEVPIATALASPTTPTVAFLTS
jgi:hypothetical protein